MVEGFLESAGTSAPVVGSSIIVTFAQLIPRYSSPERRGGFGQGSSRLSVP